MKELDKKNNRGEIKKQKTQNGDFVPFKKTFIVHTLLYRLLEQLFPGGQAAHQE